MVTATQRARFVLLCCILEVIVGIWSCFDVFVPRDMTIYVTYRCDFICKASRFFLCWMWTNMVGIWSRFDVFVTLYVTICHVHMCMRLFTHIYVYTHTRTYMDVYRYEQGKLCCHYCKLHIIWGIWSFCDVLVPTYCVYIYTYIPTYMTICVWYTITCCKATFVASVASGHYRGHMVTDRWFVLQISAYISCCSFTHVKGHLRCLICMMDILVGIWSWFDDFVPTSRTRGKRGFSISVLQL